MARQTKTITVVCRGNVARSPFAAEVIRQELALRHRQNQFRVISRGVQGTSVDPMPPEHTNITGYPHIYEAARDILDQLGIDIVKHHSHAITPADMDASVLVLAMDQEIRDKLLILFPGSAAKVHLLSATAGVVADMADPDKIVPAKNDEHVFLKIRGLIVGNFSQLLAMTDITK